MCMCVRVRVCVRVCVYGTVLELSGCAPVVVYVCLVVGSGMVSAACSLDSGDEIQRFGQWEAD